MSFDQTTNDAPPTAPAPASATADTAPAPTSATALAAAQGALAQADQMLRDLPVGHPSREHWVNTKISAYSTILSAGNRPPVTATGPTPSQLLMAKEEVRALQTQLRHLPAGHRDTDIILARLQELSRVTQHDHPLHGGPRPGEFSRENVVTALKEAGISTNVGRAQFEAALERVGASNLDGVLFANALRDAEPDPDFNAEQREELWTSWWGEGSLRDENTQWFAHVWNHQLTPADRAELYPRLTSRRVTEMIVALGKKSTSR
jgi:hypothetical protein